MRIGVIFGGRSVEHDVSIVTAHQVMAVLAARHDVVPVYVTKQGRWLTSPGLNDLAVYRDGRADAVGEEAHIPPVAGYGGLLTVGGRLKGPRRIPLDVVVPAIHGTYGEDGTIQGLFELADIPYTGSGVLGSAVGMDKVAMKAAFKQAALPVVPDVLAEAFDLHDLDALVARVEAEVGYPAFVKPTKLGSSVGIGKAKDRAGLEAAIDVARRYDHRLLIERSMEGCIEVNCSVLGGPGIETRPSVCEQPIAWQEFLSFADKYMRPSDSTKAAAMPKQAGMAAQNRRIPAPIPDDLTERVQANAVAAFEAVGAAGVARIDSFVDPDSGESWVMEINTVPGSFSFYLWEASGTSFEDLMSCLLDIAITTHQRKSELMFSFDSGMLATAGVKSGG
ncbi:MAG TPA: D-alanine--D-alanine ligase family protein [Actinomycetota bacterium]|nr:D-alanine--D-alanine ligase family protein [Actinomycetota bacterium]